MQNLLNELTATLKQDERLLVEGKLVKNKIVELALSLDESLLKLLLANDAIRKYFFREVGGVLVFDKVDFQKFVSNKQFLPGSYTAFKNRIGLTANGEYLTEAKEVVLAWPYKDCVLEGGQTKEDQKRKEIFWNETLAPDEIDRLLSPKVFTNFKRYDENGAHQAEKLFIKDNFIIKGNNLLALHSLKKVYEGKVKLIYIDPPYNTGNDGFDYNDSFNHSTWLTFMKNRLQAAKELLTPDGTIAVSIDHNELAYLLILLDEVFGIDNRKNIITIKRGSVTGAKVINPGVVNISEYVIIYSKKSDSWKPNRVYRSKSRDDRYNKFIINSHDNFSDWKFTTVLEAFSEHKNIPKTKLNKILKEDYETELKSFVIANKEKIVRFGSIDDKSRGAEAVEMKYKSKADESHVFFLHRENESPMYFYKGELILFAQDRISEIDGEFTFGELISDIWDDVLPNDLYKEGGVQLRKGKKPEKLIARLIELCTNEGDLVLDFFSGSGTTGTVSLKMNRRFIICEQLDYTEILPLQRLLNTLQGEQSGVTKTYNWQGGGSFVYAELAKANAAFCDVIEAAKSTEELQTIWGQMQAKGFISYKVNPKTINQNIAAFEELALDEQKQFLVEVLDKNQLYVNYSEIDDADFAVSEADKRLNLDFYGLK